MSAGAERAWVRYGSRLGTVRRRASRRRGAASRPSPRLGLEAAARPGHTARRRASPDSSCPKDGIPSGRSPGLDGKFRSRRGDRGRRTGAVARRGWWRVGGGVAPGAPGPCRAGGRPGRVALGAVSRRGRGGGPRGGGAGWCGARDSRGPRRSGRGPGAWRAAGRPGARGPGPGAREPGPARGALLARRRSGRRRACRIGSRRLPDGGPAAGGWGRVCGRGRGRRVGPRPAGGPCRGLYGSAVVFSASSTSRASSTRERTPSAAKTLRRW